jgi:hypothetical protein
MEGLSENLLEDLQRELAQMPQAEFPITHYFAPGLYVRAVLIREGNAMVGKPLAVDHLCIIAGDISLMTNHGMQRLTGFHVLPSKAGIKRAGFAHSDTFFATIHATKTTDLAVLEDELTLPDPLPVIAQETAP